MTISATMFDDTNDDEYITKETDQVSTILYWKSRDKWYTVSRVTFTHNPEYPTPAIHVTAPNPGIRFTVTDPDGNVLYTNVKPKDQE